MQVNRVALARGFAPCLHRQRCARRAADGFAVNFPPVADAAQNRRILRINLAVAHRADVQQQIPAARRRLREQLDEMRRRFVRRVEFVPAVGFVRRRNAFPVTVVRRKICRTIRRVFVIAPAVNQPPADDDIWIRLAHGLHDAEIFRGRQLARRVEPQDCRVIKFDEFAQLRNGFRVHVFPRRGHEFQPGLPPVFPTDELVAAGIVAVPVVARRVGISPVERLRIIKTKLDPLPVACGTQIRHRIVMPRRRVHDVVVIDLRRPHRKAIVVFRGDDEVFHARPLRERDPRVGVEIGRVEISGDFPAVIHDGNFQHALDVLGISPALAPMKFISQSGIDAPMDEHPEPRVTEPREPLVEVRPRVTPPPDFRAVLGRQAEFIGGEQRAGTNDGGENQAEK